jgi:hypothetical protein
MKMKVEFGREEKRNIKLINHFLNTGYASFSQIPFKKFTKRDKTFKDLDGMWIIERIY